MRAGYGPRPSRRPWKATLCMAARRYPPIKRSRDSPRLQALLLAVAWRRCLRSRDICLPVRSEEHTSELQSRVDLVCRLLLEKKKNLRQVKWPITIKIKNITKHQHKPKE